MSQARGWIRRTARVPFHALARRAARSYIAGDTVAEALAIADRLAVRGLRAAIGYWDPVGSDPEAVYAAYDEALRELAEGNRGDRYLAIKFPSLDYSRELLGGLLKTAALLRVRLHFDSLAPDSVDRTWEAIEAALLLDADLGCTLPSRWRRSPNDAVWAVERGLAVRVVKGQWSDPTERRINPRRGFLQVIDQLAGRARTVAVATHDLAIAREALARLTKAETPATLELLYGLPIQRQIAMAREFGVPVRIYVPYGAAYLPYCLSQLKRNPGLAWRLLRDAVSTRCGRPAAL